MRRGRFVLKWAVLTVVAVTLGGGLGALYATGATAEDGGGDDGWVKLGREDRVPDRTPPTPPKPLTPEDGALVTTTTPRFTWEASVDPQPVMYVLQFAHDEKFESVMTVENIYATEWQTPQKHAFPPLLRVYWRVMSVDPWFNESEWSGSASFVPAPDLPVDATVVVRP